MNKILSIQITRAVAAIIVVVFHAMLSFDKYAEKYGHVVDPWFWDKEQTNYIAIIGVELFFVASGFIIRTITYKTEKYSLKSSLYFIWQRIRRIIPLYWLLTCLYALVIILLPESFTGRSLDYEYLIKSLFLIPDIRSDGEIVPVLFVGWTLTLEFVFYFLFAFCLLFAGSIKQNIFITIIIAGLSSLHFLFDSTNPVLHEITEASKLTFILGVWIGEIYMRRKSFNQSLALLCPVIIIAIFILANYRIYSFNQFLVAGIPAALIIVGILAYEPKLRQSKIGERLSILGDSSYSIYLIQVFTLPASMLLIAKSGIINYFSKEITVAIITYITVFSGFILFKVIEQPVTQKIKSLRFSTLLPVIPPKNNRRFK